LLRFAKTALAVLKAPLMQKIYLLLRSNQQTGPYSLDELIQFELKPYDLIWIEGRSAGWYYPQEIPALQPYLAFLKQPPSASTPAPVQSSTENPQPSAGHKNIFVSMPSNTGKEEPPPKPSVPSPSVQPAHLFGAGVGVEENDATELKTTYTKSFEEVETDYMNRAYKTKKSEEKPFPAKAFW
jgi:hypothetical protein